MSYKTRLLHSSHFTWEFYKQNDIKEDNLIKILTEVNLPKPIREEPHGLGFNTSLHQLNIIVAEKGRSIILINGCEVLILDPAEQI